METLVSSARPCRACQRDRLGHAMLAQLRAAAIKVNAQGRLAQWVERLLYTQDVGGSSPSPPTSLRACGASAGKAPFKLRAKAARSTIPLIKTNIRRRPWRRPPTGRERGARNDRACRHTDSL